VHGRTRTRACYTHFLKIVYICCTTHSNVTKHKTTDLRAD